MKKILLLPLIGFIAEITIWYFITIPFKSNYMMEAIEIGWLIVIIAGIIYVPFLTFWINKEENRYMASRTNGGGKTNG